MAPPTNRREILARLRAQIADGKPIVGAGAGIGLIAKFFEAGGGDLIIIYNSGRFRMAGCGSLAGLMPFGNANDIVLDMAKEVLPVVTHTPVLAGVCATDPYLNTGPFLRRLRDLGFAGVQNFPTVGLIDGNFRAHLERTGMSYDLEVDLVRAARAADLLTTPYVFDAADARKMTAAGADIIVAHMGLTAGGSVGASASAGDDKGDDGDGDGDGGRARRSALDDCVGRVQRIRDAAVDIRPDVLVLCHGGPIAAPEDAAYVLGRTTGVHGFYGASSMERLPVEEAIANITKSFKALKPGSA